MGMGNGFKVGLTTKGDVYSWGVIKNSNNEKIFESEQPKKVNSKDSTVCEMSVGSNHALFTNNKKFVTYLL